MKAICSFVVLVEHQPAGVNRTFTFPTEYKTAHGPNQSFCQMELTLPVMKNAPMLRQTVILCFFFRKDSGE